MAPVCNSIRCPGTRASFLGITHAFTLMTTNQWEGQGEDKAHGMCNEMTGSKRR